MHQAELYVNGIAHDLVGEHNFGVGDFTGAQGRFSPEYFSERVFVAARERCTWLDSVELTAIADDPFVYVTKEGTLHERNFDSFFRNFEARLRREPLPRDGARDMAVAVIILGVFLVLDERDKEDRDYAQD